MQLLVRGYIRHLNRTGLGIDNARPIRSQNRARAASSHMMLQPEAFIDTYVSSARQKRWMRPRGKSDPPSSANHVHESAGCHLRSRVRNHDHDPVVLSHRENSKQFVVWKTGDVIEVGLLAALILHVSKSSISIDLTVPIASDSCSNRYRVSTVRDACDYPTLLDTSTSLAFITIQHRD